MEYQEIMWQTIRELQQQQHEISMQILRTLQPQQSNAEDSSRMESDENNTTAEVMPNEVRTTLTTAKRMSTQHPLQAQKTPQNIGKTYSPREVYRESEKLARNLYELEESYVMLERSLSLLKLQYEKEHEEIPRLSAYVEIMDEKIKNVEALQGDVAELKAEREKLHFWQFRRKREIDKELELVEANCHVAQHAFNSKYHIAFSEAHFEIKRIREDILFKKSNLDKKQARMAEIEKELDAINSEYHVKRQLVNIHPERELIEKLLDQMREFPASARDALRRVQIGKGLDLGAEKKSGKNKAGA
jgi:hypothetical protein